MLNFKVNEEECIQCGNCAKDCPSKCISMEKGEFPKVINEDTCLRCQHCLAVCPTGAVSILGVDPDKSLSVKYEMPTAHSMETLIKGRRSTRNYKKKTVETETIQKLLEIASHAPTGGNTQSVLFTATMNEKVTEAFSKELFTRIKNMLNESHPETENPKIAYMRQAIKPYWEKPTDFLLRGAPHILIASTPKTAPEGKVDSVIALTNFDLMAQSMGVGTFWNGVLAWCLIDFFSDLALQLGIPEDHEIGYCMCFGLPAVQYQRTVQRIPSEINLLESF